MNPLFSYVDRLDGVAQSPVHHPEGCALTHTLRVVNLAFRETIDVDLILAAMLHDIGKYESSLGHEQIAVKWLEDHCSTKTLWLIENHMRIWRYLHGDMKKLGKCHELSGHTWLPELIQLARWDHAGRVPTRKPKYDKAVIVDRMNRAAMQHFEKRPTNPIVSRDGS